MSQNAKLFPTPSRPHFALCLVIRPRNVQLRGSRWRSGWCFCPAHRLLSGRCWSCSRWRRDDRRRRSRLQIRDQRLVVRSAPIRPSLPGLGPEPRVGTTLISMITVAPAQAQIPAQFIQPACRTSPGNCNQNQQGEKGNAASDNHKSSLKFNASDWYRSANRLESRPHPKCRL